MKVQTTGRVCLMQAFIPFFLISYPYRVQLLRKKSSHVPGPRSIVIVYDYHPRHPLDHDYRAVLRAWCSKYAPTHTGTCVIEDLHSNNMFGQSGDQRYALIPRGGLLAGLAHELTISGMDIKNIEYRYNRVMGCAQILADVYADPYLFSAAKYIRVSDIVQEASHMATYLVSATTDVSVLARILPRMRAGLQALITCTEHVSDRTIADYAALYQGRMRDTYLRRILTADKQLLEACMLFAVLSARGIQRMLVLAGGTHCAALVRDLIEQNGYTQEALLQDQQVLSLEDPVAIFPDDLRYILDMT